MGEIIADVELENAADHELVKAGHLEDGEVRRATVRIGDRQMFTSCVVVDEGAEALVGQIVLEELDLIPDPARRSLGPRHPSEDGPLLRL